MDLNTDQLSAYKAVQAGANIFLTGPAGAGKSYLIRRIVDWAGSNHKEIAITALTGCAALLLGSKAKTLHSWAGVGLARESADVLIANILKNPRSKKRWKKTDTLVIDEISMMTPELFEKLDMIGKRVRANTRPWGGIQLIVCGDYFQLPPVVKGISGEIAIPGRFAFESPSWKSANLKPVVLTKIERQTDPAFQRLLNECRIGAPSTDTVTLLKSRQGLDWKTKLIRPTLLFSRNADVDSINEKNIAALKKPLRIYDAITEIIPPPEDPSLEIPTGDHLERLVSKLDSDANYAPHLELCVGAQVMLLVNLDLEAGLANGSRGVVVDFRGDGVPIVQFLHGDPVPIERHEWVSNDCAAIHRYQIPLRVAYAITIHKSQGATLDCALVDIGASTFEYGQAYVALSRVRDLDSLYVWNLTPSKIMAHPTVVAFYEHLMDVEETDAAPSASGTPFQSFGLDLEDDGWRPIVTNWALSMTGRECLERVAERSSAVQVYPPRADILNALRYTPLSKVKVVILGQDPYHGPGQAHGLSFSVCAGIPLPPSLKNIRKEYLADVGTDASWPSEIGILTSWAKQGVLLLNSVLTVEQGNPNSHQGIGWEDLTQRLLGAVIAAHADDPLVFLAWGKPAQSIVYKLKLGPKHTVFASAHPSPLSAHSGYFGSKPFTKANSYLIEQGATPIEWTIHAPSAEDPAPM